MAKSIIKLQEKIPNLEYVANVYWGQNTWECPFNGVAIAEILTTTDGTNAYWYIQDMTVPAPVGKMNQTANGFSQTVSFPVIKGHVYGTVGQSGVSSAYVYYYKYV